MTTANNTPVRGRRPRLILIPMLALGLMLLTACDGGDADFAAEMAKSWAQEKGLLTDSGDINVVNIGVLYGTRAVFGSTGDSEVDAALDAGMVAKGIRDADNLARDGARQGGEAGLASIDEAIALRPSDWSYTEQKGALLLAEGRTEEADEAFNSSVNLIEEHIAKGGDCRMYTRNLLTQRLQAIDAQISRFQSQGQEPPPQLRDTRQQFENELDMLRTPEGLCE